MLKIAFGIALPTIIVAGVVNGSVACKYIYLRIWSGTDVVHSKSWKSLGSWWAICAAAWTVSWVLAEAVPNFNLLLGLIAALFGSWFSCMCSLQSVHGNMLTTSRCYSTNALAVPAQGQVVRYEAKSRHDSVQLLRHDNGFRYCKFA